MKKKPIVRKVPKRPHYNAGIVFTPDEIHPDLADRKVALNFRHVPLILREKFKQFCYDRHMSMEEVFIEMVVELLTDHNISITVE